MELLTAILANGLVLFVGFYLTKIYLRFLGNFFKGIK